MSCAAGLVTPRAAMAQPAGKVYRVGSLTRGGRDAAAPYNRALEDGLASFGWIAGRNMVYEHRYADLEPTRYPALAAELVGLKPDLVVAPSTPAALAMRSATATIPIVTTVAVDPVGSGLVASLARPGGNVTGLTSDTGPELGAKLLQLLKEAAPRTTRVAVLREASGQPGFAAYATAMETAIGSLGMTLLWIEVRGPADLDRAFAVALRERASALIPAVQAMSITHARTLARFAMRHRLATIARALEFAQAGGLMAYSTDILDLYRRAAIHVDKILKGATPAELPIEQPTKFELAINLKTARALDLAIPASLSARADRIID